MIAAAGVYLANVTLNRAAWSANLRHYSTYMPSDIAEVVVALSRVHHNIDASPNLAAIKEKYAHPRFQAVSTLVPITLQPYMLA